MNIVTVAGIPSLATPSIQHRRSSRDLNALLRSSQVALRAIEHDTPDTPAPVYQPREFVYSGDVEVESIINPLSTTAGSVRSTDSRFSRRTTEERSKVDGIVHSRNVFKIGRKPVPQSFYQIGRRYSGQSRHSRQSTLDAIQVIRESADHSPEECAHLLEPFDEIAQETVQDGLLLPPDEPQVSSGPEESGYGPSSVSKDMSLQPKSGLHWARSFSDLAMARLSRRKPVEAIPETISEKPPNWSEHDPNAQHLEIGAEQTPVEENTPTSAAEEEEDTSAHLSGLRLMVVCSALSFAVFNVAMDINIITTAIPKITEEFDSLNQVGWYGSAYLMTTCSFQIPFGKIYTFFSIKLVLVSAIAVFELGSLITATSPNSNVFVAGRAIQGIGTSGIVSGAMIVISRIAPLRKRSLLGGFVGAMEGIAMVTAPIVGGVLTSRATWRWCFYINLPIGGFVIAVVLFHLNLPQSRNDKRSLPFYTKLAHLDLVGTAFLIPAIVLLLLGLQWGGDKYAWNSLGIVLLFVLAFVLLGLFAYCQWVKGDNGTIPPRIINNRSMLAGILFSFCTSSGLIVMTYYLPLWFQAIEHASPEVSGRELLPLLVSVILSVVCCGALVSALGYYTPFMILGSVFMSLGAGLLSTLRVSTSLARRILYPALFGIGVGAGFQQPLMAAQTVLAAADIPIGTSIMVFAQTFGGAVALSVAQSVFVNRLQANVQIPGVDVKALLDAGATSLESMVAPRYQQELLGAYSTTITQTFYLVVTLATVSMVGALAMQWRSVKKRAAKDSGES